MGIRLAGDMTKNSESWVCPRYSHIKALGWSLGTVLLATPCCFGCHSFKEQALRIIETVILQTRKSMWVRVSPEKLKRLCLNKTNLLYNSFRNSANFRSCARLFSVGGNLCLRFSPTLNSVTLFRWPVVHILRCEFCLGDRCTHRSATAPPSFPTSPLKAPFGLALWLFFCPSFLKVFIPNTRPKHWLLLLTVEVLLLNFEAPGH